MTESQINSRKEKTMEKELLEKIIKADQDNWNYPSPARAIKVHELEQQYKELTGREAPQWPSRGRW